MAWMWTAGWVRRPNWLCGRSEVGSVKFALTLQGPTTEGKYLMESWEISEEMYLHMRSRLETEPTVTTLTDQQSKVLSQRFAGD